MTCFLGFLLLVIYFAIPVGVLVFLRKEILEREILADGKRKIKKVLERIKS